MQRTRVFQFGSSFGGLATVGYQLVNSNFTNNGSRVTAGITELGVTGSGYYGVTVSYPAGFRGYLVVDTGGGSPTYIAAEFNPEEAGINKAVATPFASGSTWFVSTAGNDGNDGLSPATAFLTPAHAFSVATSGDVVFISDGTYTSASTFAVPANVRVIGSGMYQTILSYTGSTALTAALTAGNKAELENLTIQVTVNNAIIFPFAATGSASNVLRKVRLVGFADGIYFNGVNGATIRAYDCRIDSAWDCLFMELATSCFAELYNCDLISVGPITTGSNPTFSTGIGADQCTSSYIRVEGGFLRAENNGTQQIAVRTNSATIDLVNFSVKTAGSTTLVDLKQESTGSINLHNSPYDPTKTAGTIVTRKTDSNVLDVNNQAATQAALTQRTIIVTNASA